MMRVRFAPSPTGYLHVGGARTALFNWLYARKHGGIFVLRIEDTDAERSSDAMVDGILQGMRWLGLDWDEGPGVGGPHAPYFQSQRFDRHRAAAEQLVASGHAYRDFIPPERYDETRKAAEARGEVWRYRREDWPQPDDEAAATPDAAAKRHAIRFKVPEGRTSFVDLVHGPVEFDNANIEDFVIVRSDGLPTYHLSVVCDDIDMQITHVVRGDDHVSNTPKHVLLFEALGGTAPQFAHVPLILGPDKKRLSKRHGATSVMEYERQGYLSEAMVNFLALLGWAPGNDQELFSKDELVQAFSLDGIGTANAVFNPEKLEWMNSQHLMRMDTHEIARRVEPLLREAGLWNDDYAGPRHEWLCQVVDLFKPRAKRLPEFVERGRLFFTDVTAYDEAARKKLWAAAETGDWLRGLADTLEPIAPFDVATIEPAVRGFAEARGIKPATLMQATRLAVSGSSASPGLFEMIALVGRERTVARLRRAAVSLAS